MGTLYDKTYGRTLVVRTSKYKISEYKILIQLNVRNNNNNNNEVGTLYDKTYGRTLVVRTSKYKISEYKILIR